MLQFSASLVKRSDKPGGGEPLCKRVGDARRKVYIKPPKETNVGVARALFDP